MAENTYFQVTDDKIYFNIPKNVLQKPIIKPIEHVNDDISKTSRNDRVLAQQNLPYKMSFNYLTNSVEIKLDKPKSMISKNKDDIKSSKMIRSEDLSTDTASEPTKRKLRDANTFDQKIKPTGRLAKNAVKNFAKQCFNFASSSIGLSIAKENLASEIDIAIFQEFIKGQKKAKITIADFRNSLLHSKDEDSSKDKKNKELFQKICEMFMKYYSHNWIFDSKKLKNKWLHLRLRGALLRRIQDPGSFFNFCKRTDYTSK